MNLLVKVVPPLDIFFYGLNLLFKDNSPQGKKDFGK